MGMFDTVRVPCPRCGEEEDFQSKGGERIMCRYSLEDAPENVMSDVNRHAPYTCRKCGAKFYVGVKEAKFTPFLVGGELKSEGEVSIPLKELVATHVRQAIQGSVFQVLCRYGMSERFRSFVFDLSETGAREILKSDEAELQKLVDGEMERRRKMEEARRKHLDELTWESEKMGMYEKKGDKPEEEAGHSPT